MTSCTCQDYLVHICTKSFCAVLLKVDEFMLRGLVLLHIQHSMYLPATVAAPAMLITYVVYTNCLTSDCHYCSVAALGMVKGACCWLADIYGAAGLLTYIVWLKDFAVEDQFSVNFIFGYIPALGETGRNPV